MFNTPAEVMGKDPFSSGEASVSMYIRECAVRLMEVGPDETKTGGGNRYPERLFSSPQI